MRIIEQRFLRGPSVHSPRPSFLVVVDIQEYEDIPSSAIPGFTERLTALLPGLHEHRCSRRHPGGFVERLHEGTYMAHITEHVLIELQCVAGAPVGFGKTRSVRGRHGHYTMVCSYKVERLVEAALPVAVRIVESVFRGETPDIARDLEHLKALALELSPGPSTRAILDAAVERDIPVLRLTEMANVYQLGWGARAQRIQASLTANTNQIAVDIAADKELTKTLLEKAGLPVPLGEKVRTPEAAVEAARRIGTPVAVKPADGHQGKGVSLNLSSEDQIRTAFELASQIRSGLVIVERFVSGRDYRVLVVGGRMVAAARRVPAHVIGDGIRTVRQLVEAENSDPRRGDEHANVLSKIPLDEASGQVLARQGFAFESVPAAGEAVYLRECANLSTGGAAEDCTDRVHPGVVQACIRAAEVVGLDVAGIDVVCDDIGRPLSADSGAIVEVNAAPGLRMHEHPSRGERRAAGAAIVDHLFPAGRPSRIPVVAVTGTNGKTTVTLLIDHVLRRMNVVTGTCTTEGIYIGGAPIEQGDCSGYWSARTVLTCPRVQAAVLETARGGIIKRGLGFDRCDVGIVLNVQNDHLGQDGIDSLEDLARVKGVVAETASLAAILNADDAHCVEMAKYLRNGARPVYFSMYADNPLVLDHMQAGGRAAFLRGSALMLAAGELAVPLVDVRRLPFTLNGAARYNVANALAAAAALWMLGYAREQIADGLISFVSSVATNPLRLNVFRGANFDVLVDYAHNAQSYRELVDLAKRLRTGGRLIGVVTAPGDRSDDRLREIGAVCGAGFDRLVVYEMYERRGRPEGETPARLLEGVLESGMDRSRVIVEPDAVTAIRAALTSAAPNDLVVIGCASLGAELDEVRRHAREVAGGAGVFDGMRGIEPIGRMY